MAYVLPNEHPAVDSPASNAFAVTTNDSADLAFVTRALYVGGAGDIKVDMYDVGTTITFVAVPAGTVLPIRVKRIYATDTTATSIVGIY